MLNKLPEWDWRSLATKAEAPTLTIHGEADRVAPPKGGREWAQHLPNARLLLYPDAGHLIWAERPVEFLRDADLFLGGQWPRGAEVVTVEP